MLIGRTMSNLVIYKIAFAAINKKHSQPIRFMFIFPSVHLPLSLIYFQHLTFPWHYAAVPSILFTPVLLA